MNSNGLFINFDKVHKLKSYSATRVFAICVGELGAEICKDMQ